MPAAKAKSQRSPRSTQKQSAARKRAAPDALNAALAQASWSEADVALADALADLDELEAATTKRARKAALATLVQSMTRAARKRGLSRIGALGEDEKYDPARHELTTSGPKKPRTVHIAARGVMRGTETILRARARPSGRKKS